MTAPTLILASASARRQQLLQQIGVRFTARAMDIDERVRDSETALDYVRRMANEKAQAAWAQLSAPAGLVLAADTAVVVDNGMGEGILGKPGDADEAVAMLAQLSSRVHQVLTAVTLSDGRDSRQAVSDSKVVFRTIDEEEALRYWQTGEPRGKAGAYAIQGLGAVFVKSLSGSYSGVMGLPIFETAELLRQFGVPVWENKPGNSRV